MRGAHIALIPRNTEELTSNLLETRGNRQPKMSSSSADTFAFKEKESNESSIANPYNIFFTPEQLGETPREAGGSSGYGAVAEDIAPLAPSEGSVVYVTPEEQAGDLETANKDQTSTVPLMSGSRFSHLVAYSQKATSEGKPQSFFGISYATLVGGCACAFLSLVVALCIVFAVTEHSSSSSSDSDVLSPPPKAHILLRPPAPKTPEQPFLSEAPEELFPEEDEQAPIVQSPARDDAPPVPYVDPKCGYVNPESFVADQASEGYTLVPAGAQTLLFNLRGDAVHQWTHATESVGPSQLTEDGSLVRLSTINTAFTSVVEELNWDGDTLAYCSFGSEEEHLTNAALRLPSGNFLALATKKLAAGTCNALGIRTDTCYGGELLRQCQSDGVIELQPADDGRCTKVWEWWSHDHVFQTTDPEGPNYNGGGPASMPEKFNVNYVFALGTLEKLPGTTLDLVSLDYREDFDQILVSSFLQAELFVIDHSTTTEQATGSVGGNGGMGGGFLYRAGNPKSMRCTEVAGFAFRATGANWIPEGLPGAGNILYFDLGYDRSDYLEQNMRTDCFDEVSPDICPNDCNFEAGVIQNYLSVDEFVPDMKTDGSYPTTYVSACEKFQNPLQLSWTQPYVHRFTKRKGAAQRLENGNTLMTIGEAASDANGFVLQEISPSGETVWEFRNTVHMTSSWGAKRYGKSFKGFEDKTLDPIAVTCI